MQLFGVTTALTHQVTAADIKLSNEVNGYVVSMTRLTHAVQSNGVANELSRFIVQQGMRDSYHPLKAQF